MPVYEQVMKIYMMPVHTTDSRHGAIASAYALDAKGVVAGSIQDGIWKQTWYQYRFFCESR